MKSQSLHLVETHRRQAELEEQLAFFKIDSNFDSVANILRNSASPEANSSHTGKHNVSFDSTILMDQPCPPAERRTSPLPPAPYIGKSSIKIISQPQISAAEISTRRTTSSSLMDAASLAYPGATDSFQQSNSSHNRTAGNSHQLFVGMSPELSSRVRQLDTEIKRISNESSGLPSKSDNGPKIEDLADRLTDDISICLSRLSKLRADIPDSLKGSVTLTALLDSMDIMLQQSQEDIFKALHGKEGTNSTNDQTKLSQQHFQQEQPLKQQQQQPSDNTTIGDTHLFTAATSQQSGRGGESPLNRTNSQNNNGHRFLSVPHRFLMSNPLDDGESSNDELEQLEVRQKLMQQQQQHQQEQQQRLELERQMEEKRHVEEMTQQLMARLQTSEQVAEKYKADMEQLKNRLESLTAARNVDTPTIEQSPVVQPVVTSTPKSLADEFPTSETQLPEARERLNKTYFAGQQFPSTLTAAESHFNKTDFAAGLHHQSHSLQCPASFDLAAAAYKHQLKGLDRRLDTHEHFVLNAFGTLLDRYIQSPPTKQVSNGTQRETNTNNGNGEQEQLQKQQQEKPQTIQVVVQAPNPPVMKARSVQVNTSISDDECEREMVSRRSTSGRSLKHSTTDSNIALQQQQNHNDNFEKMYVFYSLLSLLPCGRCTIFHDDNAATVNFL